MDGAHAGYTKLLEENVTAVIGPSSSAQVVGIADVIATGHTLTVGRTSTSPLLTTLADDDFFFRIAPSDTYQAKILAKVIGDAGLERLCLANRQDTYGTYLADEVAKDLAGAVAITRTPYDPNQKMLSGVLAACDPLRCPVANADAGATGTNCSDDAKVGLLLVSYPADGAAILDGAPDWSAAKQKFFFTDGARDVELLKLDLAPARLQGARGTIPSGPDPSSPAGDLLAQYRAAFQTRYGRPAPAYSEYAFDAVYAIAAAIEVAGTTERTAVRNGIRNANTKGGTPALAGKWADIRTAVASRKTIDLRGATGNLDFDASGDITPPLYYRVWRIEDGTSVTDQIAEVDP